MSRDPFKDPRWKRSAARFRKEVLPQIASSARVLVLNADEPDVKMMLEIGAAICLDKPIVLLVPSGREILPRLARIADKVITVDISTEAGQVAAQRALTEYLRQ